MPARVTQTTRNEVYRDSVVSFEAVATEQLSEDVVYVLRTAG